MSLSLFLTTLVASYLPSRCAASVDEALRAEQKTPGYIHKVRPLCLKNKSMRLEILRDLSGLEVSMADLQGSKSQRSSKKQATFMRLGAPRRMEDCRETRCRVRGRQAGKASKWVRASVRTQSEKNEVTLSKGPGLLFIMRYEDGGQALTFASRGHRLKPAATRFLNERVDLCRHFATGTT